MSDAFPADFLTIREERMPKAQLKAYAWCAEEYRLQYNWMAFFDMDEYLVLRGEHAGEPSTGQRPNLKGFLDRWASAFLVLLLVCDIVCYGLARTPLACRGVLDRAV